MRRTLEFKKEFQDYRDKFGDIEYARNDILPGAMAIVAKYWSDTDLRREVTIGLLDKAEAEEDKPRHPGLFPYKAQIALGDGHRIKRGRMNTDQHLRRKRVIDRNRIAQDVAWAGETRWIDSGMDALRDHPPGTVREVVLNEDGTKKALVPA